MFGIILAEVLEWPYFYCWLFHRVPSCSPLEEASLHHSFVRTWALFVDFYLFYSSLFSDPEAAAVYFPHQYTLTLRLLTHSALRSETLKCTQTGVFGKAFVYNNFRHLEQFSLFIKYISAFFSWLSTCPGLLKGHFRTFFLPNNTRKLHIDAIKASNVIITHFLCRSNFTKHTSQHYSAQ